MSARTLGEFAALLEAHGAEASIYLHAGRWTVRLGTVQVTHPDLHIAMAGACNTLADAPIALAPTVEAAR